MRERRLCPVEGLLPQIYLLYRDGGAEADIPSCRPMPKDKGELPGLPVFFIPSRRVTRLTLREFVSAWCNRHHVKGAIDVLTSDLPEEFYLPLSTAYSFLSLIRRWCLSQFAFLGINPNGLTCLYEMRSLDPAVVLRVFDPDFLRILKPP